MGHMAIAVDAFSGRGFMHTTLIYRNWNFRPKWGDTILILSGDSRGPGLAPSGPRLIPN